MDVNLINVITLAYMGDALFDVRVRKFLINKGIAKVEDLQREAIKYVSAKSQSKILDYLLNNNFLTNNEIDIVKRGRNYRRDSHPKNTDIITYKMSTGFECLIGYLYLDKQIDRMNEIIDYILGGYNEENS